jgi:hypothetical protein
MMAKNPNFAKYSVEQILHEAAKHDMGVWAEVKRGYTNAAFQWEWYELAQTARRLALIAPREHGKSEILTVNNAAWHALHNPGFWIYIFCNSGDQGEKILSRIAAAVAQVAPELVAKAKVAHTKELVLGNDARITVRGSGAAVRGAHPDLIIGDDVQDENNVMTQMQRDRLKSWWFGTVGGMAHPGTSRVVQQVGRAAKQMEFPATRILLVGTPFHSLDLLMSCKDNPMYQYRLYSALQKEDDGTYRNAS